MMADFNGLSGKPNRRKQVASGASKLRAGLEVNYHVLTSKIFHASDFGVPQNRPRFITIGICHDAIRTKAAKENAIQIAEELLNSCRDNFLEYLGVSHNTKVTCAQAISDLETSGRTLIDYDTTGKFKQLKYSRPKTTYQRELHGDLNGAAPNSLRLPNHRPATQATFSSLLEQAERGKIPTGRNLKRDTLLEAGVKKHYFAILDKNSPSRTISTLPDDILHYSEPRILTVRETARIQSFPDWFEFTGKYTTGGKRRRLECPRYTQVGNAVAPRFAQFLGRYLLELDNHFS
jgi:DNA (cytosine-5)-methyltransferase 1